MTRVPEVVWTTLSDCWMHCLFLVVPGCTVSDGGGQATLLSMVQLRLCRGP